MKRLRSSLCRATGAVAVELQFGKDEHGKRLVTGGWSTRLWLICQRCLEPMGIVLSRELHLELVQGTEEWSMALDFEPMQVFECETVSLLERVGDELILALPMVPGHAIGDCRGIDIDIDAAIESQNPFGVLAKRKTD
ncbi:MAG: YceD family protein [Gammaproteobacteria bacterium]